MAHSAKYEGEYNRFVAEMNDIAALTYGGKDHYLIFFVFWDGYPLAWSWLQWRRRVKLQHLREFVRSEYDHACLRSCRSRALYEGLKSVPPTTWYRFVAGLNAQLRLVRKGRLKVMFQPVIKCIDIYANPALRVYGISVDLAWFQATTSGYFQYGLLVYAAEEDLETSFERGIEVARIDELSRSSNTHKDSEDYPSGETLSGQSESSSENLLRRKKPFGGIIDTNSLEKIKEGRDLFYLLSFIIHNTKPVGHQDLVGLVISILLLADFSLVLLTFLQLYSVSLAIVFLVLFILPLGILLPFPAGINALFSHGPRRSAGLARVYALWNITSLVNVMVAFICGYTHFNAHTGKKSSSSQPWNFNMDESEWWIFPVSLVLCKCVQSRLINWHVANLEIQDRSLYSTNFDLFWQS